MVGFYFLPIWVHPLDQACSTGLPGDYPYFDIRLFSQRFLDSKTSRFPFEKVEKVKEPGLLVH